MSPQQRQFHYVPKQLKLNYNPLRGTLPKALSALSSMHSVGLERLGVSGPLPEAVGAWTAMTSWYITGNSLSGALPDAMISATSTRFLALSENRLSGWIPEAFAGMPSLTTVTLDCNRMRGSLPEAIERTRLIKVGFTSNRLTGSIPDACRGFESVMISGNALSGSAMQWATGPDAADLLYLSAYNNEFQGALPEAMSRMLQLQVLDLTRNHIRGSLPDCPSAMQTLALGKNELSGSIPWCCYMGGRYGRFSSYDVHDNMLTGALPQALLRHRELVSLECSGNAFEGSFPPLSNCGSLQLLDVSGVARAEAHIQGPLPPSLRRASKLSALMAHNQMFKAALPSLASSLHILVLHRNHLEVLPDMHFFTKDDLDPGGAHHRPPVVLLHQNLFSCHLPDFQKTTTTLSLAAFGNQFWHPLGDFPSWIAPAEQDGLLFASIAEGRRLALKFCAGACLFFGAVLKKLGFCACGAIARWQLAGGSHGALAQASVSELFRMLKAIILTTPIFTVLLPCWDLYKCPGTLSMASACLRDSTLIHIVVVLSWGSLCVYSHFGRWLHMCQQQSCAGTRQTVKSCLLCCAWIPLTLLLSAMAVVDQAGKSVPGFFQMGTWGSKAVSICIGVIQSLIINAAVPSAAKRLAPGIACLASLTSLLVICFIPAFVIFALDSACMEQWTAFWTPCTSKHGEQLNFILYCNDGTTKSNWCPARNEGPSEITVLKAPDICTPQGHASASHCVHVVLLRLQDVWLSKWITSGLIMPAFRIFRQRYAKDTAKVIRHLSLGLESAALTSAPLPVLAVVMLVARFCETLLAATAWEKGTLRDIDEGKLDGTSWIAAQTLSAVLYLAFSEGDPLATLLVTVFALHLCRSGAQWQPPSRDEQRQAKIGASGEHDI